MLAYQQSSGHDLLLVADESLSSTMPRAICLMHVYFAGRLMGLLPNDREVEAGLAKR